MDWNVVMDDVIKLVAALVVGGLIGAEREYRDKTAGFRTIIFIAVGSGLFTILSERLAHNSDPARVAAQIVTGVGFLGAGAILRHEERVLGLTTAATIWLAAALGMGAGSGHLGLTAAATAIVLVVLWLFPYVEHVIDRASHTEIYTVITPLSEGHYQMLREAFASCGLHVFGNKRQKIGDRLVSEWLAHGSREEHDRLTGELLQHPEVIEFRS